jgi:hypothetical protein
MTLDELAPSIPNGFHDAELNTFAIDYTRREARLILDIWVADDLQNPDEIETYRLAELALSGLAFWISEPPDANYPYGEAGELIIDIGPMASLESKRSAQLPAPPAGAFVNWIFVANWNAFIYVAAEDARLEWLSGRTVRPRARQKS